MRLAEEYGGRMLYLPTMFAPDHKLVKLLGLENAQGVLDAIGPDYHLVPLGPNAGSQRRRREIAKLYLNEKLSAPAIAARVGVHVRTVYRVTERMRGLDDNQLELFARRP